MSTASELADRLEARAKEIDECIRGGDYGTGTGADNAGRWSTDLHNAARLLRDHVRLIALEDAAIEANRSWEGDVYLSHSLRKIEETEAAFWALVREARERRAI